MFFLLAKIFWFLIQPVNLAIILGLFGLLLRWVGRSRSGTMVAAFALIFLAVCTWTNLGAVLIQPLEERHKRPSPPPAQVAGIVVLGGGFEGGINKVRGGYDLNSGGDRFVEAAVLAHRYPEARIVITGGSGALMLDGVGDAETAPRMLEGLGVARDRLILENESRDTYENAVFTRRMVEPKPGETWLLVTSAFHMPRSLGLFRKAGFVVTPWPTDYRTTGQERFGLMQDNPVDSLQNATLAVREWIGLVAYRLTGRIDELVP